MICSDWLDLMLEGEPAELRGEGDSALAGHLRSCAGCRAKAGLLLRAMTELDQGLAAEAASAPARPHPKPGRLRRRTLVALPLAAAAIIGFLLLGPLRAGRSPVPGPLLRAPPAAVPVVTPPPGRDAAVIQTDNPDIVIVWLY